MQDLSGPAGARPTVFVFCRAYQVNDFRANFEPLADRYRFCYLTEGHQPGTQDTRADFYRHHAAHSMAASLSHAEIEDVRTRCRVLRNIERAQAVAMLHAMACTIESRLQSARPDVVVGHMVDEYVSHLVSIYAGKLGVRFVGYCSSFFPDRVQWTEFANGRPFDVREPGDEEVDAAIAQVSESRFRQNYGRKPRGSWARHLLALGRYRAKVLYFAAKRRWERDPLNVHYMSTPHIVEFRSLRDFPTRRSFSGNWRSDVASARCSGGQVLYVPLGYFPESTIDYWTTDTSILAYEDKIVEIVRVLASRFIVVVKEHPHMVGARNVDFYRRLNAIAGVVNAHPLEFSSDILEQCDGIVLGGGSGGVEAHLRDRPIFSYADTTYWFEPSGATFLDLQAVAGWPAVVAAGLAQSRPRTMDHKRAFVRQCLRSTLHMRVGGVRWPLCDIAQLDTALTRAIAAPRPTGNPNRGPRGPHHEG